MSTYQEQYKCASEEMVVQVNQMLTMFTIDLAQYRTGKFDGRCNAGVTFDAMQKTVGQAKYHMNRSIDVMSRIHDPPLTCVPGKCVVCHALSTLHNLKIYAEGFETYVDNHRRAMADYGVHCDNLKAEFKSFLDIGIQDCGHLLWMGNFLVKVHVSGNTCLSGINNISHSQSRPVSVAERDSRCAVHTFRDATAAAAAAAAVRWRFSVDSASQSSRDSSAAKRGRYSRTPTAEDVARPNSS